MSYKLLAGGYRDTLTLFNFDSTNSKIHVISESPVPTNASWLEVSSKSQKGNDGEVIYSLVEDEKEGAALSLVLKGDKVEVTGKRMTHGAPAHVHVLKDGSGVVLANYVGGSAIFFPTEQDGSLSKDSKSPLLEFEHAYKGQTPPNPDRQEASHLHQVVEGSEGRLYMPDLGSDKIWVVKRDGDSGLKVEGWLQAPAGAGPRHVVLSPDEKHLYCLTELSHEVLIFSLADQLPSHPKPDFKVSVIPPNVPESHSKLMDSAEIQIHPTHSNIIYASNRLELHIHDDQKDLPPLDNPSKGDAVTVIILEDDGLKVKDVKYVRTEADSIRAMRVSKDGKYVALAGQRGGGVEIWQVEEKGVDWKLAGKEEKIENVTDVIWL